MPVFARQHAGHDMGGGDMGGMDMGGDEPSMGGMSSMKMYMHGSIGGDLLWFASWQPSGAGATVGVCIGLFVLAILDRWVHAVWRACSAGWARGKVGLAMPVASGTLPSTTPSGTSSATALGGAVLDPMALRRRDGATGTATATTTASDEKAALAIEDDRAAAAAAAAGGAACACGCGGECGAPSAQPCGGTGTCAPDYDAITPKDTPPELASGAEASYLPRAVRDTLDPARPGRWSRPFRAGIDIPRGLMYMLLSAIHFLLMLVVMSFQIWWIISVVVGLGVGEALFGRFGADRI